MVRIHSPRPIESGQLRPGPQTRAVTVCNDIATWQLTPLPVQLTLLDKPCLVCAAVTLPLNNGYAIGSRRPRNIQALAAVARNESISRADGFQSPLLVCAAVTLPLDDRRPIVP